VTTPRQRMVPVSLAVDLGLTPLLKRAVYIGLMQLAEDSGCFIWNPRDVRSVALPLERDVTDQTVEQVMRELETDGYVWSYEAEARYCGFVPAFPEHQRSLTRWNVPQSVPLPPGITYEPIASANRYGSCRYTFPKSKSAMQNSQSANESSALPSMQSLTQGAADSLQTDCEQVADDDDYECPQCGGKGCAWCAKSGN